MNEQMSMQPLRLRCNSNTHGSRWDIGMTARIASGNRGGLDGGSQETKDGLQEGSEFATQAKASAHVNGGDVAVLINGDVNASVVEVAGGLSAGVKDAHGAAGSLEAVPCRLSRILMARRFLADVADDEWLSLTQ